MRNYRLLATNVKVVIFLSIPSATGASSLLRRSSNTLRLGFIDQIKQSAHGLASLLLYIIDESYDAVLNRDH